MRSADLKALLKRVVELVMPDLRAYYRVVRKAQVVKSYASDGRYFADVQPLRNDESVDESEPVLRRVEIPVIWAGAGRGVVCPPAPGSFCDLSYYDGDPDYPRISNFRWHGNGAPACEAGALIIQQASGVSIKIDAGGNVILSTNANRQLDVGGDYTADIGGGHTESVGGDWTVEAAGQAMLKAPVITLDGNVVITGNLGLLGTFSGQGVSAAAGSIHADDQVDAGGDMTAGGNLDVNGNIACGGSNPNHHTH